MLYFLQKMKYNILNKKERMNMAKIKRDPKTVAIANAILEQYQPETKEDVQDALKDIFGPIESYFI